MKDKENNIYAKVKMFCKDSIWSIAALVLMNIVSQFVVYPIWAQRYGSEVYGNIVYAMSLINIFAVSVGVSTNYARMSESSTRKTVNGDYNRLLCAAGIISGIFCFLMLYYGNMQMSKSDAILAGILCLLTLWRYYADVEYRMKLNYKGYFLYYLIISSGYLLGILLFLATDRWPLALMPGEFFGLFLVWKRGSIWKGKPFLPGKNVRENTKTAVLLILTNLISNIIFNGDRILLQNLLGGVAVTVYYLASLMGKTMSLITTPLNSVIIGYISKYQGKFTKKMISWLFAGSVILILAGTIVGVVASYILIAVLYPKNYEMVRDYFFVGNLTQVFYFVTNIITTILLRIAKADCQLKINICYAVFFIFLCIPGAILNGIDGFCYSLLMVNMVRYLLAVFYCYRNADKEI